VRHPTVPRIAALAVASVMLLGLASPLGFSQLDEKGTGPRGATPQVSEITLAGSSVFDIGKLPQVASGHAGGDRPEREPPPSTMQGGQEVAPIGSGLASGALAPAPAPDANFEGLHFTQTCAGGQCGQGHPPDTNGDVGPDYYIQAINVAIGIYDKTTGSQVASFTFDSFMSQASFDNLCDTDNFGDPVVLYDTFHGRWVITDFAFKLDTAGNVVNPPGAYQCFAVSQSGDPVSGGWNFYSLHLTDGLQDYPKFGIWPDGLYMSANMFDFAADGGFQNVQVWALNLAQMEAGAASIQVVAFDAQAKTGPCPVFTLLPGNARLQTGTPPAGRPNYFASVWCYTGRVRIWQFHVDWTSPASSTFTGPIDSNTGSFWAAPPNAVPSRDGNDLDTLAMRLMMQNQYTNIAGVESLWDSHTVAGSSSSQAAVRWYQVPVSGGSIGNALQAATWNPSSANRFMPSLAVDQKGDMAIGYSTSSASVYPAIRYAGRLAGDPANTFSQSERMLIAGGGSQTGNCGGQPCERWGDYSAMTLDPSDGCTFWYTNEYYSTSGLDHHTRIGSFSFPSCLGTPPTVTAPSSRLYSPSVLGRTTTPVRTTWSAHDPDGIASYTVQRQRNGGSWITVTLANTTSTSVRQSLAFGDSYRYRVRATDGDGLTSAYARGPTFVPRLKQESGSGVTYAGAWSTATGSSFSGGSARYSTAAGARARYTFTGASVSWVAARGPSRGSADVFLDGTYVTTVNLHASNFQARRVVYVHSWGANGSHTLKIVVSGTKGHARVDVDAFARLVRL
jgi:hypothetical protein